MYPLENGIICPECRISSPLFTSLFSLSPFTPRVRDIIHKMKYGRESKVAKCLGMQMALFLTYKAPFLIGGKSLIVPVPLTFKKLIHRGFNQSDIIAKSFAKLIGVSFLPNGLKRVAELPPLAGKMGRERQLFTEGVFRINSLNMNERKNIILVDDVATSLSTLNSCTREIYNIFGKKNPVYAITAARSF